jgi:hypothetical protein
MRKPRSKSNDRKDILSVVAGILIGICVFAGIFWVATKGINFISGGTTVIKIVLWYVSFAITLIVALLGAIFSGKLTYLLLSPYE